MAEPVSPNLLTDDQRARRQRIIDAGLVLLERNEYERIQIKDVAEEADVALGTLQVSDCVRQSTRQNLPQPGGDNSRFAATQIVKADARPQKGLLNDIGRVELATQPCIQVNMGKHAQILAEWFYYAARFNIG